MTDNEIIKSMQCVIGNEVNCSECTYQKVLPFPSCRMMCSKNALGLINRQKAEIERLSNIIKEKGKELELANADKVIAETHEKAAKEMFVDVTKQLITAKSEAIKEFMNRLKKCRCIHDGTKADMIFWYHIEYIVKEMTEIETNQRKEDEKND